MDAIKRLRKPDPEAGPPGIRISTSGDHAELEVLGKVSADTDPGYLDACKVLARHGLEPHHGPEKVAAVLRRLESIDEAATAADAALEGELD